MTNLYEYPVDSEEYEYNSFSAKYYRIFGCAEEQPRNPRVQMGKYENVHDDLYRFLSTVDVSQECLDDIATFRRVNNSWHDHYSSHYTPELADLVYEHNRAVIDEFGYEMETPVSRGS